MGFTKFITLFNQTEAAEHGITFEVVLHLKVYSGRLAFSLAQDLPQPFLVALTSAGGVNSALFLAEGPVN